MHRTQKNSENRDITIRWKRSGKSALVGPFQATRGRGVTARKYDIGTPRVAAVFNPGTRLGGLSGTTANTVDQHNRNKLGTSNGKA